MFDRAMPLDLHDPSQRVYNDVLEGLGSTPLIRLNRVTRGIRTPVYAKAEYQPRRQRKGRSECRSSRRRRRQARKPGGTIVEAGRNTGLALAIAAAIKGYRCVFVMPDKMSLEKQRLLKAFGARIVVTPTAVPPDHPDYYLNTARKIAEDTPNSIFADQFYNRANTDAHYATTAPEIWEQTEGRIAAFVAGMGTGGTISGVGRYLKEQNPAVRVVGADPVGSILKRYKETGEIGEGKTYMVEGIGMDKVPATLDIEFVDEIRTSPKGVVPDGSPADPRGGLFVGDRPTITHVAQPARELTIGPLRSRCSRRGWRYLSKFHSDEWMRENRMLEDERVEVAYVL
jgi:cystathionine beta-synthase